MADGGPYRFQQPRAGPYYYPQQHQQNHHQRHLPRNGSPVNNGRGGGYNNDTPSPSRSPVSQATSHNPFGMYSQGHQQAQQMMMNGGGHQGYMPMNMKYQHQNHQQHHGQQNHHHQQNHVGGHSAGMGHQHTFSSGTMSSATPNFSSAGLQNNSTNNHSAIGEGFPEHWAHQLQLAAEVRSNDQPHHHARKEGVVPKNMQPTAEDSHADSGEERNRSLTNGTDMRQHWYAIDMAGQGLHTLAPSLFDNFLFLTRLYLDHNDLMYLSTAIGQLRSLEHLDVSKNQLVAIPPEIGMLSRLREFLLFDNKIRKLPAEMGLLYRLELLGIEGNEQLDHTQRTLMIERGTKALVTHLREESQPGPPPEPRPWEIFDDSLATEAFSVLSYNILCDKYATTAQYGYTPLKALDWDYRCKLILEEIKHYDADFVCLQELDQENFSEVFRSDLAYQDYKGYFCPKTRAKTMIEKEARTVDGCATFWKGSKYICLAKEMIDLATIAINRPDMKGEHDVFNRVMTKDNIALVNFFENRLTGSRFIVVNAHIFWDPHFDDVKLVQVAILMEQVAKFAEKCVQQPPCTEKAPFRHSEMDSDSKSTSPERAPTPAPSAEYSSATQIPLLICGDFNSGGDSGVYELITRGSVAPDHCAFGDRKYGNFTRDGIAHQFSMKSAYNGTDELSFTNYTPNFSGVLDYIWYSSNALQVRGVLGDVDLEYLRRVPGFPNHHFPSDHLPIKAEFSVKPRKTERALEGARMLA